MKALQKKILDNVFEISIALKGVFALIEIAGGALLVFVSPALIINTVTLLTQDELIEDPKDIIANYFVHLAKSVSIHGTEFASVYLITHGFLKLVLIIALLRKKLWAYPLSLAVFGVFVAYQIYRFTFTQSIFLILLSIFDLVVMWLIWREYQLLRPRRA